jgi:hypothetical protein
MHLLLVSSLELPPRGDLMASFDTRGEDESSPVVSFSLTMSKTEPLPREKSMVRGCRIERLPPKEKGFTGPVLKPSALPTHIVALPIRAGRFVLDVPNVVEAGGYVNNYFRE